MSKINVPSVIGTATGTSLSVTGNLVAGSAVPRVTIGGGTNDDGIVFGSLGTATIGIDQTGSGLGSTDLGAILQPVLIASGADPEIGTWAGDGVSSAGTANITDVGGAAHGLSIAVGDLVHISNCTTASHKGFYRIITAGATTIVLDRVLAATDTNLTVTFYKDVIGIFATDGTNGQRIMNYSHQDKPLQIGGDVLAATGHGLGSEDVLIGGKLEINGDTYFDSNITMGVGVNLYGAANTILLNFGEVRVIDDMLLTFGSGEDAHFIWETNGTADFLKLAMKVNNAAYSGNFVIGADFRTQDFDHAISVNPTIFLHSALDPDTSNNQWGSFAHDQEDFVITTGANTGAGSAPTTDENGIKLFPRGGSAGLHVKGLGELHGTLSAITVGTGTVNITGNLNRQLYKVTTTYDLYTDSDTTKGIVIATLPAKMKIVGVYADTTTPYTGGAVSAATLEVGITAEGAAEILAAHDVLSGAVTKGLADADMGTSMTRAAAIQGGYLPSWTGTTAIYATIDTTTANTSALTAGSTTFYIETEQF